MRVISGASRGTKLFSLEGENTRPTLDRVKEALFNIIQMELNDAIVLDLFAGSGALGIEALSRGAKKFYFCDSSIEATNIINKNLEKTKLKEKSKVYKLKFEEALKIIKNENIKFDIIFLDPPYKTNYISKAIEKILEYNLIKDNTLLVLETDEENRVLEEIKNTVLDIYDVRKYGRVSLLFSKRKG